MEHRIPFQGEQTLLYHKNDGTVNKCRDYIFNFLADPLIPSDNNGSERGIRKLKIKLKNSCTFRSDFGADAFLELHSIVETAKKHNITPLNAIQALFEV
ncbi:transposase [uncultured Prevotella sp.]|uniref:IS66 family transposase n=1 Tax=uncultured Prevotella sp. TaxID=159272 RepID=UPI002803D75D|nr:transposase [uncultured Prevotella sp.]